MLWRCAHFDDLQAPIQVLAASTHQDINMQKSLSCHPTYSYNKNSSYECDDRVAVMIDNPQQIYPLIIQQPQKRIHQPTTTTTTTSCTLLTTEHQYQHH